MVERGVAELGRLDFVLASAGVIPGVGKTTRELSAYLDAVDVMLVHPTGIATPMIVNERVDHYAVEHPEFAAARENLLPVSLVEPSDIRDAMIYLCGQSGRYVTAITLPVDAAVKIK